MANKKVSQLTSKPSVLTTDLFPIADPSTGQLFKTTISDLGTAIGSGVSSVNTLVGAVVLDTDDIQELASPTNKWFTDTRARAALSASSPLTYNSGTGAFGIQVATGSQNGYLSSTDWTTFNDKQDALINPVTGTGTTNYIPKFTAASALGDSNIQDSGTLITLGSNTTISSGSLGIGSTSLTGYNLRVSKNITGATTAYGIVSDGIIQSDVTTNARGFSTLLGTINSSFTLTDIVHYQAQQGTIGASSTVTNQYGFVATSSIVGATNNYGFFGSIPSGTNRWNLYMSGTADNYLAGSLGIGVVPGAKLHVFNSSTGVIARFNSSGSDTRFSANSGVFDINTTGSSFAISTSSIERLRVNLAGNLLIGSTADNSAKLQVTGNSNISGTLAVGTAAANTTLQVAGSLGMGGLSASGGYPQNAKHAKNGTNSVVFTLTVPGTGNWSAGHALIKCSGAQNGLQETYAALYFVKLTYFSGGGVISTVNNVSGDFLSATVVVTSTTSGSPQVITITISDVGATTNTFTADIDATIYGGIVSLT